MYTILIVEDEKIERESLVSMILKLELPISEVLVAQNGEEGYLTYKKNKPDIILADITMPLLSGLDMIERIRKDDQKVVCMILTSYDYFSYAQKAIRLGVEDFILKPADSDTLFVSLTRCVQILQQRANTLTQTTSLVKKMKGMNHLLKSECFYAILTKQNEFRIMETFQLANVVGVSCICYVFEVEKVVMHTYEVLSNQLEDLGYSVIMGSIANQMVLFIIANRSLKAIDCDIVDEVIKEQKIENVQFAKGSIQEEVGLFYQSFEDAKHNLNSHVEVLVISSKEEQANQINAFALYWSKKILDNPNEDSQKIAYDLCHELLHKDYDEVNALLSFLIDKLIEMIDQEYQFRFDKSELHFQKLDYQNYQNLEILVSQLLNKIMKPLKNLRYQNNSHIIKKSMHFIEQNYAKPISLNSLADNLGVSPFYISKLFSKELQRNFTEIINDLRIKEAKKLIRKDYSFKEVAYKVGFASQSYFTKIFKKSVGMSPKEYRKLFP